MEITDEIKRLSKADKVIIGKMMTYLYTRSINQFELKNIHAEIVGMAAEGALRGESLEAICGPDYKKFCDDLSANCLHKTRLEVFLEIVMIVSITFSIILMFVYWLDFLFENPEQLNGFMLTLDANSLFGLLVPAFCGGLGAFLFQRNSFSKKSKTLLLYSIFFFVSYFILRFLSDIFFQGEITINILYITIITFATFLFSFFIKRAVAMARMKAKQHAA